MAPTDYLATGKCCVCSWRCEESIQAWACAGLRLHGATLWEMGDKLSRNTKMANTQQPRWVLCVCVCARAREYILTTVFKRNSFKVLHLIFRPTLPSTNPHVPFLYPSYFLFSSLSTSFFPSAYNLPSFLCSLCLFLPTFSFHLHFLGGFRPPGV